MFNNFFHILSSFCFSITTIFRTKSDNLHQLWAFLDGKNTLITPSFGDFSSYILTQTKWHHCDKMVTSDPLPQKKLGQNSLARGDGGDRSRTKNGTCWAQHICSDQVFGWMISIMWRYPPIHQHSYGTWAIYVIYHDYPWFTMIYLRIKNGDFP